jgi:predicted RNA binding protein YcfA (HicA-like mRNA interferase family)
MNSKSLMIELKLAGWKLIPVRGSHHVFRHPDLPQIVVVPHARKDLPPGTVHAIRRHAGLVT